MNSKHIKRMESFQKVDVLFSNNIIPEMKRWANKFPSQQNAELRSKFICGNIVASKNLSSIPPSLTCFKMPEAPVGNTYRNREDHNMLKAVKAKHTGAVLEQLFFGQQGDGFPDKGKKAQVVSNVPGLKFQFSLEIGVNYTALYVKLIIHVTQRWQKLQSETLTETGKAQNSECS